ncbi:peptidase inhibitor family I36 protein [Streptomyces sp. NPDC090080]|uniref:peptidase inhibitor family I36 protein n=1 Tax=Streptomyces sp. NPDC090080 TaxID=3365939 RepID=UPI0037FF1602
MKKLVRNTLTSGVMAVAAISVCTVNAEAAASCPANAVCFYEAADFHGSMYLMTGSEVNSFRVVNFYDGSNANDRVTSIINNRNSKLGVYKDTYGGHYLGYVGANSKVGNLSSKGWDNKISSAYLGSTNSTSP